MSVTSDEGRRGSDGTQKEGRINLFLDTIGKEHSPFWSVVFSELSFLPTISHFRWCILSGSADDMPANYLNLQTKLISPSLFSRMRARSTIIFEVSQLS